jgi:hypothetical protein
MNEAFMTDVMACAGMQFENVDCGDGVRFFGGDTCTMSFRQSWIGSWLDRTSEP